MIIERGRGRDIIVRARTPDGQRYEKNITGYWPYCYVEDKDVKYVTESVKREPGYTGLYGEKLTKITTASPSDVSELSQGFKT